MTLQLRILIRSKQQSKSKQHIIFLDLKHWEASISLNNYIHIYSYLQSVLRIRNRIENQTRDHRRGNRKSHTLSYAVAPRIHEYLYRENNLKHCSLARLIVKYRTLLSQRRNLFKIRDYM